MTITEAVLKHYADELLARNLRLAVIQNQYSAGNLTEDEARKLLAGPLSPNDPATIVDDSIYLVISPSNQLR